MVQCHLYLNSDIKRYKRYKKDINDIAPCMAAIINTAIVLC